MQRNVSSKRTSHLHGDRVVGLDKRSGASARAGAHLVSVGSFHRTVSDAEQGCRQSEWHDFGHK